MKTIYPAIFTQEENGMYSVVFPDLEGCFTCGDDLEDAVKMAEEAIGLYLSSALEEGEVIPEPTAIHKVVFSDNDFVTYVRANLAEQLNDKIVRKTVTIPQWMNVAAEKRNLNFSAVLREGLVKYL